MKFQTNWKTSEVYTKRATISCDCTIFDKMSLKMCLSDDYKIEVTDNTEIFQIIYYLENKLIAIFTCKVHIQSNKP